MVLQSQLNFSYVCFSYEEDVPNVFDYKTDQIG